MIKWAVSGQKKLVKRLSLCFNRECQSKWDARVTKAKAIRDKAELLIEYFAQVEKTSLTTNPGYNGGPSFDVMMPQIKDEIKTRISYLIRTFKSFNSNINGR